MKTVLILCLIVLSNSIYAQTPINQLLTYKYTGTYSYGKDIEKERIGNIFIYPETDSTILFYIDLNRGAPSYNMGSHYGRVVIKNGMGIFYTKNQYENGACQWSFEFSNKSLTIKTIKNNFDCAMGHGVYADGVFDLFSHKLVEYFENQEGRKTYYSKTKPEAYYSK